MWLHFNILNYKGLRCSITLITFPGNTKGLSIYISANTPPNIKIALKYFYKMALSTFLLKYILGIAACIVNIVILNV